jgi:hypothetical protein
MEYIQISPVGCIPQFVLKCWQEYSKIRPVNEAVHILVEAVRLYEFLSESDSMQLLNQTVYVTYTVCS